MADDSLKPVAGDLTYLQSNRDWSSACQRLLSPDDLPYNHPL